MFGMFVDKSEKSILKVKFKSLDCVVEEEYHDNTWTQGL